MEPLTSVEEVESGLDWDLSDKEKGIAEDAIEDLSDDARHYGLSGWSTTEVTPRQVSRLVRRAAQRYMKNYDGYIQSRAGDETLVWDNQGEQAGSPYFTKAEIAQLRSYKQQSGLVSVELTAYGPRRKGRIEAGLVPVEDGSRPFPMFPSDGPW
jgi:hypothetical protein